MQPVGVLEPSSLFATRFRGSLHSSWPVTTLWNVQQHAIAHAISLERTSPYASVFVHELAHKLCLAPLHLADSPAQPALRATPSFTSKKGEATKAAWRGHRVAALVAVSTPLLSSCHSDTVLHEPADRSSRQRRRHFNPYSADSPEPMMETQTRPQPELRPVWTGPEQHEAYPRPSPLSARSPLYSASLRRDGLPSPMYPTSPGFDQSMRMRERAMVESLDQRPRFESQHPPSTARSLSPISEQSLSAWRVSVTSLPPPRAPAPSPSSPGLIPYPRRQTLADETRLILLSGIPDGLPRPQLATIGTVAERRQSLPSSTRGERRGSQQLRHELQAWGHVYFDHASESSCFVLAVALRRSSDSSSADEVAATKGRSSEGGNRVTIRARVRPCAFDRKPFLLRRTFDMDQLRATIPELTPMAGAIRRPSTEFPRRIPLPPSRRRASITASTAHYTDVETRRSPVSPVRTTRPVPIHLNYALTFFPVLAALMYSGYIHARDIIDLPMPYPEAWVQTVAHVYTGQGELTEAIKQNILYLGGKV